MNCALPNAKTLAVASLLLGLLGACGHASEDPRCPPISVRCQSQRRTRPTSRSAECRSRRHPFAAASMLRSRSWPFSTTSVPGAPRPSRRLKTLPMPTGRSSESSCGTTPWTTMLARVRQHGLLPLPTSKARSGRSTRACLACRRARQRGPRAFGQRSWPGSAALESCIRQQPDRRSGGPGRSLGQIPRRTRPAHRLHQWPRDDGRTTGMALSEAHRPADHAGGGTRGPRRSARGRLRDHAEQGEQRARVDSRARTRSEPPCNCRCDECANRL